jgi:pSer/pThr/pTyr-binding forkhead associated (FHA) protein
MRPDDKPRFDSVLLVDVPSPPPREPLPLVNTAPEPLPGIDPNDTAPPPRVSLGFIAFDDGTAYSLDADYVVGREPGRDERIVNGAARELQIDDAARTVSRIHAEIRVEGPDVLLVDRGSTNGTFVWDDTTRAWTRLTPAYPQRIQPGMRGAFGQRTFVYDAPQPI